MQRRTVLKRLAVSAALALSGLAVGTQAQAAEGTIKVGVLHSLSGTMAISETVLKDVTLMAIDEINAKGGVMGYKIEPVVVDPASNWPLFAEKAVLFTPRARAACRRILITMTSSISGETSNMFPCGGM